jgi:Holliday junction resolvase RusA-like endonuclease
METFVRLPYPPVSGNHAYHNNRDGSRTLKEEVVRYRASVTRALVGQGCEQAMFGSDGKPLWVEWHIHPPIGTRDVDNFRKVLADALSRAGFWVDDSGKVLQLEVFHWFDPVQSKEDAWVDLWIRDLPEDPAEVEALTGEGV